MSKKTWHGDGIYSRTRRRKSGEPMEVFYGRVWIKSRRGFAYFKLATTPRQAERKMREILGDPEGALADRQRRHARVPTFGEVLDSFLAKYRSRGGTRYYRTITRGVSEQFGELPITEIGPQRLDAYLEARRAETTKGTGRRRLSESTLRKEIVSLGTVFQWARRRGLVNINPIADYEKPKEPSERTIAVLSAEQEKALRVHVPPWVWEVIEWALYSGMRLGEILSLRWRELDRTRELDRARGVIHVAGGKTGRSRTVPLHVSEKLSAILERRPHHIGSDLVFCERDGRPLDANTLNRALERAARAAGIAKAPGVLWNRFRHTWATRLAATGKVSIFEISKWMGNSVTICEKHYAAYLPGSMEKAAGLLDAPSAAGVAPTVAVNTPTV